MRIKTAMRALPAAALTGALLVACGGGSGGEGGEGGASGGSSTTSSTGGGSSTTSSAGGAGPVWIAETDPAKGELPEGLFVAKGEAYMGFAALGTIVKVALPAGTVSDFGALPPIPANGGFLLGIVVDGAGNAYVGFGGGPGTPVKNGVYKIPAAGGSVTEPFAADPAMSFPNGLLLDGNDLFVADSGGSIFKITPDGTVAPWLTHPTLSAAGSTCASTGSFPIGANGIVKIGSAFYVSNSSFAQIVKIPVQPDGTAGAPSVLVADCSRLGGLDGIAVDPDGTSLLSALNSQSKLVRVGSSGAITELHAGAPLDNPASVAVEAGSSTVYITNSSFASQAPKPGLLAFELH